MHRHGILGNPDGAAVLAVDLRFEIFHLPVALHAFEEFHAARGTHIELAADVVQLRLQFLRRSEPVDAGQRGIRAEVVAIRRRLEDAFDGVEKMPR